MARLADAAADRIEMDDPQPRILLHQRREVARQPKLEATHDFGLGAAAHGAERVAGDAGITQKGHAVHLAQGWGRGDREPGRERHRAEDDVGLHETRPYRPSAHRAPRPMPLARSAPQADELPDRGGQAGENAAADDEEKQLRIVARAEEDALLEGRDRLRDDDRQQHVDEPVGSSERHLAAPVAHDEAAPAHRVRLRKGGGIGRRFGQRHGRAGSEKGLAGPLGLDKARP